MASVPPREQLYAAKIVPKYGRIETKLFADFLINERRVGLIASQRESRFLVGHMAAFQSNVFGFFLNFNFK